MFGWFKRKTESSAPAPLAQEGEPLIAALLLEEASFDLDAAHAALQSARPGGRSPGASKIDRGILQVEIGDEWVFAAPMPAPYPWSDLEGPTQTSWMWPPDNPATSLRTHQSHVLVTAMKGKSSPVERRVAFTQLMATLAIMPGVVGVYWPEATLVHFPPIFAELAASAAPDAPPLFLWVDFRVFRNEDGSSGMFTTGLAPLGLMEMEIPRLQMSPGEMREWGMNIAAYMLDRGAPIPHGDTLGATAQEQLKVTHGPSSFGARGPVMHVSP